MLGDGTEIEQIIFSRESTLYLLAEDEPKKRRGMCAVWCRTRKLSALKWPDGWMLSYHDDVGE